MASTSINVKDFRTEIPGALSEDGTTWEFPAIESVTSRGKTSTWRIYVRVIAAGAFVDIDPSWFDSSVAVPGSGWYKVDSGLVGGKIKESSATIVPVGKNIGRASATNAWTQALRDAFGAYNRQLKKSTSAPSKSTTELYPPMLAQVYKSSPSTTPVPTPVNPVYMQRKYNGVRMVATLERIDTAEPVLTVADKYRVVLYSRKRNLYAGLNYLRVDLLPTLAMFWDAGQQIYLDGEVYLHGAALQDISGSARRAEDDGTRYNFMIYDCFIPGDTMKFSDRHELVAAVFDEVGERAAAAETLTHLHMVETEIATSTEEIDAYYSRALADGYEGAMIRLDAPYSWSYNDRHSRDLLKMKPSFDSEFNIVAWTADGVGKAKDALMIVCEHAGKRFPVTPAMEIAERVALANLMPTIEANGKTHFENHWLGRPLIVTFDERSKDDLPLRARTRMQIRTWD